MTQTIYLDMDGVVADWDRAATEFLGADSRVDMAGQPEGRWPEDDWNRLKNNQHFYSELPEMPQARELVGVARQFRDELKWDLLFLTAIPRGNDMPWAFNDKIRWAGFHFPDISVHFGPYSHEKYMHCSQGDILVDDRLDNCNQWRKAGGVAVQVTKDYDRAIRDLTALFSERRFGTR